jgi:hypothetical protein
LRDAFALAATNSFEPFQTVLDGALQQVLLSTASRPARMNATRSSPA